MLRKALTIAVCLGLPSLSYAEPWHILGPRAMGMGGAGVALADGGMAQYWNPAGLSEETTNSKWGLQVPVGVEATLTGGVLNDAKNLNNMASQLQSVQNAQKSGGAIDAAQVGAFVQALPTIADLNQGGKGALVEVSGGGSVKIGPFSFSLNSFSSLGASPYVDLTNIGLGSIGGASGTGVQFGAAPANCALCNPSDTTQTQAIQTIANSVSPVLNGLNSLTGNKLAGWNATNLADFLVNQAISHGLTDAQIQQAATQIAQNIGAATPIINAATSGNSYTNNTTNLTLRAASFEELAMGYSHALPIPGLLVGGNIKIIEGLVGFDQYKVMNNGSNNDALSNLTSNIAKSVQPGLDLGVLWKADKLFPVLPFNPRLGIVGRNLNNPKFDQPAAAVANGDASRYAENGQIRMGVALSPTHFWNITADMDLTNNLTPVDGYHSRLVGLGTEVNVFNRRWINIPLGRES